MLGEILDYLHNYFVVDKYIGTIVIKDGLIEDINIADGQYYRIIGSVFNDGVDQYPGYNLTDETFDGAVWTLAVPRELQELAEEIKAYNEKNGASPYTSESWGGYSYTKPTDSNGRLPSWKAAYRSRLRRWKKI